MRINAAKIVAQKVWRATPKKPLVAIGVLFVLPIFGVLTAFGIAPNTALEKIEQRTITQELPLPNLDEAALSPNQTFKAIEYVQRGDTVSALLEKLNVDDRKAFEFLRTSPAARSIYQLRPGRTIAAETNSEGQLITLDYFHDSESYLHVSRTQAGLLAEEKSLDKTAQSIYKSGRINSSLFAATDGARIPDAVAMQIAKIFSTDIDFHSDLRKGDNFSVIYEMLYHNGEFVGPGRVLAAQFVNADKPYEAYLFTDREGNDSYYSADGQNRAKSFLRSPLEFSRVSSNFGGRMHPIHNKWRRHTGVDLAAPKGTPIWASADGVVVHASVKGGYGKAIEIRHNAGVSTLYGHLTEFAKGIRAGARVNQGQTIGYVGATGWATGPHLHYEFKVAGILQDPLKVVLPKSEPLPAQYRTQFTQLVSTQANQLALLRTNSETRTRFE